MHRATWQLPRNIQMVSMVMRRQSGPSSANPAPGRVPFVSLLNQHNEHWRPAS